MKALFHDRAGKIVRENRSASRRIAHLLLVASVSVFSFASGAANEHPAPRDRVNWREFLAGQDLVWERMSDKWGDHAFLGNGHMGAMIFKDDANTLKWEMGHNAVTLPAVHDDALEEVLTGHRILIGDFLLMPAGAIDPESETMRMDLWNAEARGAFKTDKGEIRWRSFIHATNMVMAVEVEATGGEADGLRMTWRPEKPLPAKSMHGTGPDSPPASLEKDGDINVHVQKYKHGGLYALAWTEMEITKERRVLYVSVVPSFPGDEGKDIAVREIRHAAAAGFDAMLETHRKWWHEFWPAGGFLSISDPHWENFYWAQIYKLACATRHDSVMMDGLNGPWLKKDTPWTFWCLDLNVQLCYWPLYGANRLDLAESLVRNLDKYFDSLVLNVPPEYRDDSAAIGWASSYDLRSNVNPRPDGKASPWLQTMGDLPWFCHNYWLHYRHSMDDERLKTGLFPLLKRATGFYFHFMREKGDGKLHLIPTHSPEYGAAPDCNFDLALLRWGCLTLIAICDRLGIEDPMREVWEETLERLAPYPVDETGLTIGQGVPLAHGHRHYSHLLSIYPLYLVNRENPDDRALMEKSLQHWAPLPKPQNRGDWMGFSYTGASSMAAALGNGDNALEYLNEYAVGYTRQRLLKPNTKYDHAGGPGMESAVSVAQCVHDMLIQSWGGRIRVFPAVPSAWGNVVIHNLRTEGAFLVSARRENGKTVFARIRSLAGEPCRVWTDLAPPVKVIGGAEMTVLEDNFVELALKRGEEAVLYSGDAAPDFIVSPVPSAPESRNRFGLKRE